MMLAMKVCTVVAFVFVSAMLQAGWGTDVCIQYADGCNSPNITQTYVQYFARVSETELKGYKLQTYYETFSEACNRRDACYRCGVLYSHTKGNCDRQFLSDMKTACDNLNSTMRANGGLLLCKDAAKKYHTFETESNAERYLNPAADYCNIDNVLNCFVGPHSG